MQFYLEDREEKEKDADKNICPKFKEVNSESTPTPTPSTAKEDGKSHYYAAACFDTWSGPLLKDLFFA